MANPYKSVTVPFVNRGLTTKVDPGLLQEGQYQVLTNVVSTQEGVLQSRNGSRKTTAASPGSLIHSLARCNTGSDPTYNYRYIGEGKDIYRIGSDYGLTYGTSIVPSLLEDFGRRWSSVSYRKASSGSPYQYFATSSLMLKDCLEDNILHTTIPLINWGIPTPVFPAGPVNYINAAAPTYTTSATTTAMAGTYSYRHTLRNPRTGEQGNPSMPLKYPVGSPTYSYDLRVTPGNLGVYVDLWPAAPARQNDVSDTGYYDDQCFSPASIAVYRANHDTDGVYRLVGYSSATLGHCMSSDDATGSVLEKTGGSDFDITWPAGKQILVYGQLCTIKAMISTVQLKLNENIGAQADVTWMVATTYEDTCDDAIALLGDELEQDNDPPVTSASPLPFFGSIESYASGSGAAYSYVRMVINIIEGFPNNATAPEQFIRPGTLVQLGGVTGEFVICQAITSYDFTSYPKTITIACLITYGHDAGGATPVEFTAVANHPAEIACEAYNSIWLAGDSDNRNVIYRSKPGRPCAFPIANAFEVGSPTDQIEGITEYNGHILSLNRSAIYEVPLWNDVVQRPVRTPANRGVFGKGAWCQGDNAVWYLSYDGVYSWQGGMSQKRSEAINQIFTKEKVGGVAPISLDETRDPSTGISDLDRITLTFHQNCLYVIYRDTDGNDCLLVYNTLYDRWHRVDPGRTVMFNEADTGNLLISRSYSFNGTVDTISDPGGSTVLWQSGDLFDRHWQAGRVITINGVDYTLAFVGNDQSLKVVEDAGEQAGVTYTTPNEAFVAVDEYPVDASGFTTDFWEFSANDGDAISYEIWTPAYTLGEPSLQKQWGDVVLELENPSDTTGADSITVNTYYDHSSTPDATDVFTITPATGRRRIPLPLQSGKAKEAYTVAFRFTATTRKPHKFYSLTFNVLPLEKIQRGRATDWDDLGHPYDKKLTQVTVEYDSRGENLTMNLDTMTGIEGDTINLGVQTWTLQSQEQTYPPTAGATGPIRGKITLPINDGTIAKMVRLRIDTTTTTSTSSSSTTTTTVTTTGTTTATTTSTTTATTTTITATTTSTTTTTVTTTSTATTTTTTTTGETTTTTATTTTTTTTT